MLLFQGFYLAIEIPARLPQVKLLLENDMQLWQALRGKAGGVRSSLPKIGMSGLVVGPVLNLGTVMIVSSMSGGACVSVVGL